MRKRSCLGALLICLLLQITGGLAEWDICRYDFADKEYHFSVPRSLDPGTVVGKVDFITCGLKTNVRYESKDSHFEVQADGAIVVKEHLKLHGHKEFGVVALEGNNVLTETTVTLRKRHPHHRQAEHPSGELRRQKRDWVIPPIQCSENERGPFPKRLIPVKSNRAGEMTVFYSITGQGADSPPVGTFIIERTTGWIKVTRPLDRETIPKYVVVFYAVSSNGQQVETPIEAIIKVTDQNDNRPVFTQPVFGGSVVEGSRPGTPVMNVTAEDADDTEDTNNGILAYSIVGQNPPLPTPTMFTIDQASGLISVVTAGLDHELYPVYTLTIKVADQEGAGYETSAKAVITVTDANDNAPVFDPIQYSAKVPENAVGYEVALLTVTDDDTPYTDAWTAVYKIVKGNEGNLFGITTTPDNMGQLTTVKGLDFETKKQYILLVAATNKAGFSVPLVTSTATVMVDVEDVNEAPIFVPLVKNVTVREDLPSGQEVASYTAQDPDKAQIQKITYRIGNDPAGWLSVNPDNGIITVNGQLDRESVFVKNNIYKAIVLAVDNGIPPTTGTGTLQITLQDVNDNGPELEYRDAVYCLKNQDPLSIKIIDRDLPPFTAPYKAQVSREARDNWTIGVQNDQFLIKPSRELAEDLYIIPVTIADGGDLSNTTMLKMQVCQCTTENVCDVTLAGGLGIPVILGILGGTLALLILILPLLLFVKKPLLPPEDKTRRTEGGGEENQGLELGQLHPGLDSGPGAIYDDVTTTPPSPPRPANPDEIGDSIEEIQ
ncbi:cadherin-1-like [Rana temporaria]|uniref:cadherin-1-like n=1 Tax=Rana temporaria TaxID=8407 RepID=UPI001AADFC86|nr:cadherin-1-like [Rana temporaria]